MAQVYTIRAITCTCMLCTLYCGGIHIHVHVEIDKFVNMTFLLWFCKNSHIVVSDLCDSHNSTKITQYTPVHYDDLFVDLCYLSLHGNYSMYEYFSFQLLGMKKC